MNNKKISAQPLSLTQESVNIAALLDSIVENRFYPGVVYTYRMLRTDNARSTQ